MGLVQSVKLKLRQLPRLLTNIHLWIITLLFLGSIVLHYPQIIPYFDTAEPESFLFLTRHSLGRLILLVPIAYTALTFGLRAGIFSLIAAMGIMIPDFFTFAEVTADDLIEIIAIFVFGLVINLWLDSYNTDKKHRQQAFMKLESAQRELQRMQQNLRYYLKQITFAQEEERRRIAQELHDDTAQDLVVISRKLDSFVGSNKKLSINDINELEDVINQVNRTLHEVRRFSQDLRPSVLDDLGLIPALEWLVPELGKHFKISIKLKVCGKPQRFSPETELVLFRIAQEAMRNTGKHAKASKAWVTISFSDEGTTIIIKDNGQGFELPETIGDLAAMGKLGLVGMQERVQLIGGKLEVSSKPRKGTVLTIGIPNKAGLQNKLI